MAEKGGLFIGNEKFSHQPRPLLGTVPADVFHRKKLTQAPDFFTFSETQYTERIANQEPWYARCAVDLRARPAVFIGTELREETLWQHLELRRRHRPTESTVPPPGSILVTPALSSARVEMLESFNIDWYEGTAESFAGEVLNLLPNEIQQGFRFLKSYEEDFGRVGIPLVSELAAERPTLATEYLLGGEPIGPIW